MVSKVRHIFIKTKYLHTHFEHTSQHYLPIVDCLKKNGAK